MSGGLGLQHWCGCWFSKSWWENPRPCHTQVAAVEAQRVALENGLAAHCGPRSPPWRPLRRAPAGPEKELGV